MTEQMGATDLIYVYPSAVIGYQPPAQVYCHDASGDGVLQRVVDNDPDVAGLDLFLQDRRVAKKIGRALIHNKRIQKLILSNMGDYLDSNNFAIFCKRLAKNRSINHLTVRNVNHSNSDLFVLLAPFFAHNANLRCIEISYSRMYGSVPSFVSSLMQPRANRLERIGISECDISDKQTVYLVDALNKMSGLSYLLELCLSRNRIGVGGCTALCELLKKSTSRIQHLDLRTNNLDDECIGILIDTCKFKRNTLKTLYIGSQSSATSSGWLEFTGFLSNPGCSLAAVSMLGRMGDYCYKSFHGLLTINKTLKHIDIGRSPILDTTGWRQFLECLSAPDSALEALEINECCIDDERALLVISTLSKNTSLRMLNMSYNSDISCVGWIQCFRLALDLQFFTLEDIDFSKNNIDDEACAVLVDLLFQSKSVSSLSLYDSAICNRGWIEIFNVLLPNSSSQLKALRLGMGNIDGEEFIDEAIINDDVITCFANSLVSNSSLKSLVFGDVCHVSRSGWDALVGAMRDTSSIESTYYSNHTLQDLRILHRNIVPDDVTALLRRNGNQNKVAVARQKILDGHFSDLDAILRIFGQMDVNFLPYAFSWMGRDRDGFSVMYYFLRYMSWMN